jgi:hypothetical protein
MRPGIEGFQNQRDRVHGRANYTSAVSLGLQDLAPLPPNETRFPMKSAYSARRLILLTAILPTLGALAQTETKPVSEEVLALPEFSVSTASDDSFVATESTSGTRVVADIINLPLLDLRPHRGLREGVPAV